MIELISNKILLDNNYEIREYITDNGNVRALVSEESIQSLIYIDKCNRDELVIDYFNFYNIPIDLNPFGKEYLMLGGGCISYPHYYLNKYKDKKIDVVEINGECIKYAKEYFFVDELLTKYSDRINIIYDDALNYISYTDKKYDYVLIDLFNGRKPINEIYSEKNIEHLKSILKDNGIIVINYIINNNQYKYFLNNIKKIAKNHKIITNNKYFNYINKTGNIIILLSNNELKIPFAYEYDDVFML